MQAKPQTEKPGPTASRFKARPKTGKGILIETPA